MSNRATLAVLMALAEALIVVASVSAEGVSCATTSAAPIVESFPVVAELLFGLVFACVLFCLTIIVLRPLAAPALTVLPTAPVATAPAAAVEGTFLAGADTFAPVPLVSVVALVAMVATATVVLVVESGAAIEVGVALATARTVLRDPESFNGGTLSRAEVGAEDGAEDGAEAGAEPEATRTEPGALFVMVIASTPAAIVDTEAGAVLTLDAATAIVFVAVFVALGSVLV